MKMLDGLPEHFVGWPVTGIQSTFEIHPGLHFGLFHRECCRPLQLSEPQMQRRVVFVLKSCFFGCCVCLNKISHLLVPPKVNFLPLVFSLFSTPSRFRTITEPQMKLQLFWTSATPPPESWCARNKDNTLSANVFLTSMSARTSHFIR